jgi:Holliday junction DNA helicase RuvA
MFYYLNGKVTHIEANLAVVDCGGVGYACRTSARTLSEIKTGDNAKLYTYLLVREDAFEIYGFAKLSELNAFKSLLSVSGVGAKSALAILSASAPEDLAVAIVGGDEKALTLAPGIGRKIAQRILLELKDKFKSELGGLDLSDASGIAVSSARAAAVNEVAEALIVLGYTTAEVNAATKKVPPELLTSGNVGEIIRHILKGSVK